MKHEVGQQGLKAGHVDASQRRLTREQQEFAQQVQAQVWYHQEPPCLVYMIQLDAVGLRSPADSSNQATTDHEPHEQGHLAKVIVHHSIFVKKPRLFYTSFAPKKDDMQVPYR
jgi:hypothetical protein